MKRNISVEKNARFSSFVKESCAAARLIKIGHGYISKVESDHHPVYELASSLDLEIPLICSLSKCGYLLN